MSVGRKVFHCVVDDTALSVNIGEIKKWTSQGAITLIVPLYSMSILFQCLLRLLPRTFQADCLLALALERLHTLKKSGSQVGSNAREAVGFLDRVTSGKHNIPASKVVLQGPMEQFENWAEAEQYFLPEFQEEIVNGSSNEQVDVQQDSEVSKERQTISQAAVGGADSSKSPSDLNEMSQMLLNKLNFKKDIDARSVNSGGTRSSPTSPMSGSSRASPEYSTSQLANSGSANKDTAKAEDDTGTQYVVPKAPDTIKPLLNAVLWRLHAQPEASAAPTGCILVTNDRVNQSWAQKFGITVKSVPQLRTSIIYEEREFKNHCKYLEKNQSSADPRPTLSYDDESDEDVLVFVPRGQGRPRAGEASPGRGKRRQAGSRVSSGQVNGAVKARDVGAVEPGVEAPSVPIDPDSFSRNISVPKSQQKTVETISANDNNRGASNGSIPRGGGRRGGGRGTSGPRGGGRGRGRLWVP